MSNPRNIPKPRHLFPEAAAVVIQGKRGLLRARWALQTENDWFPAWSIGSIAGVCGVLLAITLFFMKEPDVEASTVPVEQSTAQFVSEAETTTEILPTESSPATRPLDESVFPNMSMQRPNLLGSTVVRTRFPFPWDQREVAVVESMPKRIQSPLMRDSFLRTDPYRQLANAVRPYYLQGATIPLAPSYVMSLGHRSIYDGVLANRDQQIIVRKNVQPGTSLGEPMTYQISVTNPQLDPIDQVTIRERVTAIQQVSGTSPPASVQGDELVWSLGTLGGKQTKLLEITIVPAESKQIETQTVVQNTSRVGGIVHVEEPVVEEPTLIPESTIPEPDPTPAPAPITEAPRPFPELKLAVTPVNAIKKGEVLSMTFSVTNVGTAAAENVTLYVNLSDEFKHRYGEQVKHTISRLEPGQTRKALFQARAKATGTGQLQASLAGEGASESQKQFTIKIESQPQVRSTPTSRTPLVECQRPDLEQTGQNEIAKTQWRSVEIAQTP